MDNKVEHNQSQPSHVGDSRMGSEHTGSNNVESAKHDMMNDKTKRGKIAFMLSGQGAQYPGMGKSLYETSKAAKEVFDRAEALRPGTIAQCFSGSAEELAITINTQPCLYCVDLAAAEALREAGIHADILSGFSLGELAALTFSGAVGFDDGFRLCCTRATLMQKAAQAHNAAMVAVLKLSDDDVIALCSRFKNVYPVNFNCEGQVVVSGAADELEEFKVCVKEAGGRAMPLKVGGGFHSPFMTDASNEFAAALRSLRIERPKPELYSNVTAQVYGDDGSGDIVELLSKQVCSPVLWRKQVENMISAGADTFIEAGPGKTLCGFVSRISDNVRVFNAEDYESLIKTVEGVG